MCKILSLYCTQHEGYVSELSEFCSRSRGENYCLDSVRDRHGHRPKKAKRNMVCERCSPTVTPRDPPSVGFGIKDETRSTPRSRSSHARSTRRMKMSQDKYKSLPLSVRIVLSLTGAVR